MIKLLSILAFLSMDISLFAANDTIPAGVYHFEKAGSSSKKIFQKQMVNGNSSHLDNLEVTAMTLPPGQKLYATLTAQKYESLVIVKEGTLNLSVHDSSKNLTAGGIALVVVNDPHQVQNNSSRLVSFFIIKMVSKSPVDPQRDMKGKGSFMKNWDELVKTNTDKGESRPIFDQPTPMFSRFDAHATALNPGISSHDPHTHPAEEIILVIKGNVTEQIGKDLYPGTAGDVLYLASNVLHNVKNTGSTQCGYFAIQWRE